MGMTEDSVTARSGLAGQCKEVVVCRGGGESY